MDERSALHVGLLLALELDYLLLMRGGKGGWDGWMDECTINTTVHAHGSEL